MTQYDDGDYGRPRVQFALPAPTPVVRKLIVVNVGVFLVTFLSWLAFTDLGLGIVRWLGLTPDLWRDWFPLAPLWQLVSYGFLHSLGSLFHLFFNMLMLYFFGGMLEGIVGGRRFLVHYLIAVAVGGLAHLSWTLAAGTSWSVVGASGAVMAVTIAVAVMRPNATVFLLVFPIKLKWLAIALVVLDVFPLLIELKTGLTGNVAHIVHLAGALYGFLAVRRRWIWRDPISALQRKHAVAAEEKRISDEARMDQLLQRIQREGIGSLSARDREFLSRMSQRRGGR